MDLPTLTTAILTGDSGGPIDDLSAAPTTLAPLPPPGTDNADPQTFFNQCCQTYNKEYDDPTEYWQRLQAYNATVHRYNEQNQDLLAAGSSESDPDYLQLSTFVDLLPAERAAWEVPFDTSEVQQLLQADFSPLQQVAYRRLAR